MTRPWKDVPGDILGVVLNKLHQTDRCRFRAVCKNWQVTEDRIDPCLDTPWMIKYSRPGVNNTVMCTWIDPYYSEKKHQISKWIDPADLKVHRSHQHLCYSNNNWSLLCYRLHKKLLSFVLHSPFSNDLILLPGPRLRASRYKAVFTGNPASSESDCEVLVLVPVVCEPNPGYYMCRYRLSPSRDNKWSVTQLVGTDNIPSPSFRYRFDIQHIDGKLYCLFYDIRTLHECTLGSYSLADKTWKSARVSMYDEEVRILNWKEQEHLSWLAQMGGDLLMLINMTSQHNWMIFRFDWGHWRWVLLKDLKNAVFFVSWESKIIFHAPLEVNNQDCLIIHAYICCDGRGGPDGKGLKCYSLQQRKHVPVPEPYAQSSVFPLCFIPPPVFRKPGP